MAPEPSNQKVRALPGGLHYSETRFAANGGPGTTPKLILLPVGASGLLRNSLCSQRARRDYSEMRFSASRVPRDRSHYSETRPAANVAARVALKPASHPTRPPAPSPERSRNLPAANPSRCAGRPSPSVAPHSPVRPTPPSGTLLAPCTSPSGLLQSEPPLCRKCCPHTPSRSRRSRRARQLSRHGCGP